MQDKLSYDNLYTKLSAAIVIWQEEITRKGRNPEGSEDRRIISSPHPRLINFGEQYAHNMRRNPRFVPSSPRHRMTQQTDSIQKESRSYGGSKFRGSRPQQLPKNFQCFQCGRTSHWRAQCPFENSKSLVSAVRARIREIGGPQIKQLHKSYLNS